METAKSLESVMVMRALEKYHQFTKKNPVPTAKGVRWKITPSNKKKIATSVIYSGIDGSIVKGNATYGFTKKMVDQYEELERNSPEEFAFLRYALMVALPSSDRPWAISSTPYTMDWTIIEFYGDLVVWGIDRPLELGIGVESWDYKYGD